MFRIYVRLTAFHFDGLKALDWCRKLGLPDATTLSCRNVSSQTIDVSEGFARQYFDEQSTIEIAEFDVSKLQKNELVQVNGYNELKLSDERVKELFVANFVKN